MTKEQYIYENHLEKEKEDTAKTILNMSVKEYDYETTRARSFDTRSGIFMGFIGTILVFLMSQATFIHIDLTSCMLFGKAMLIILSGSFLLLAVVGFLVAMHFFINTISVKEYKRLPTDIPKEFLTKKNLYIMQAYINLLSDSCNVYRETNETKSKNFRYACRISYISVILIIFSYIFSLAKHLVFGV